MSSKIKSIIADVVQGGVVIGAILAIIVHIPGVNVVLPAQDVTYIVTAAGIVNAIVALLRPYASAAVALVKSAAELPTKGSK